MTDIATYDPENCALTINAGGYERRLTAAEIADNWNGLTPLPPTWTTSAPAAARSTGTPRWRHSPAGTST